MCLIQLNTNAQIIHLSDQIEAIATNLNFYDDNVIQAEEFSDIVEYIAENILDGSNQTLVIDCYDGTFNIEDFQRNGSECTYQIDEIKFEGLSDFTIEIDLGVTLEADFDLFNSTETYLNNDNGIFTNRGVNGPSSGAAFYELDCAVCDTISKPCIDSHHGSYMECYNYLTGNFFNYLHQEKNKTLCKPDTFDMPLCGMFDFTPEAYNGKYNFRYVEQLVGSNTESIISNIVFNDMMSRIENSTTLNNLGDYHNALSNYHDFGTCGYAAEDLILTYIFQELGTNNLTSDSPLLLAFFQELDICSKDLIRIFECNNITLTSKSTYQFEGELESNLDDRPIIDMKSEHGNHGVNNTCEGNDLLLIKKSDNISIKNLILRNGKADNVIIDGDANFSYEHTSCNNILLDNIMSYNAGRNNITPLSFDTLTINNCQIWGTKNWHGIGINIEPYRSGIFRELKVSNCYFKDNEVMHMSFQFYNDTDYEHLKGNPSNAFRGKTDHIIENCIFDGGSQVAISYNDFKQTIYDTLELKDNSCNVMVKNCGFIPGEYPSFYKSIASFFRIENNGYPVNENDCKDIEFTFDVSLDSLVIYANHCDIGNYYEDWFFTVSGDKTAYFGNVGIDNIFIIQNDGSGNTLTPRVPFRANGETLIGVSKNRDLSGNAPPGYITLVEDENCNNDICLLTSSLDCCLDPNDNQYHLLWWDLCNYDSEYFEHAIENPNFEDQYNILPIDNCFISNPDEYIYSNTFNVKVLKDTTYQGTTDKYEVFKEFLQEYAPEIDFIPDNLSGPSPDSFTLDIDPYCNGITANLAIRPNTPFDMEWEITDINNNSNYDYSLLGNYNSIISNNLPSGEYTVCVTITHGQSCDIGTFLGRCPLTLCENIVIEDNGNPNFQIEYQNLDISFLSDVDSEDYSITWYFEEGAFFDDGQQVANFELLDKYNDQTTITDLAIGSYYSIIDDGNGCEFLSNVVHVSNCNLSLDTEDDFEISDENNDNYLVINSGTSVHINPLTFNNFFVRVNGIIHIMGTLYIEDIELLFSEGSGIIVHEGGALHLGKNTVLDGYCYEKWEGITVKGNTNTNHPTQTEIDLGNHPLHGYLHSDNAHILNAHTGVKVLSQYTLDSDGNFVKKMGGGIIQLNNTRFTDNLTAIEICKHIKNVQHRSYIKNCDFKNSNVWHDIPVQRNYIQIFLEGADNIPIEQCSFVKDLISSTSLSNKTVKGIQSISGGVFCDSGINCCEPNTFHNLNYGIEIHDIYASGHFINGNHFYNVKKGITATGTMALEITDNTFNDIPAGIGNSNAAWGIYADQAFGLNIANNKVKTEQNSSYTYGVIIKDTESLTTDPADFNKLQENYFSGAFEAATLLQGNNSFMDIDCNHYGWISSYETPKADWQLANNSDGEFNLNPQGCDFDEFNIITLPPFSNQWHDADSGFHIDNITGQPINLALNWHENSEPILNSNVTVDKFIFCEGNLTCENNWGNAEDTDDNHGTPDIYCRVVYGNIIKNLKNNDKESIKEELNCINDNFSNTILTAIHIKEGELDKAQDNIDLITNEGVYALAKLQYQDIINNLTDDAGKAEKSLEATKIKASAKALSFEKNLASSSLAYLKGTTEDKIIDISINNINEYNNSIDNSVFIYPNPNSGSELYIQLSNRADTDIETIEICDLNGKVHLQKHLVETERIDLKQLQTGIYIINILTSDGQSYSEKLSIIR